MFIYNGKKDELLMAVRVQEIISALDIEAPFSLAEEWDNVGLLVGDPDREVRSVLIGLDPTNSLIDEALTRGADTVLTHHPAIFRPLPNINTGLPEGKLLEKAISNRISIIACHTNLDSCVDGVSDILANLLGLSGLEPLLPTPGQDQPLTGLGRLGSYEPQITGDAFLTGLFAVLELPSLQVAGPLPDKIGSVAICGGSGSDLAEIAKRNGADIYLSAEIKHNVARWAEEHDFCIVDGTHYGTEQPAVRLLADKLKKIAAANGWNLDILVTHTEKHPFAYIQRTDFTST